MNHTLIGSNDFKNLNNESIMAIIMGITMLGQSIISLLVVFIKLCKSSTCWGNTIRFRNDEALGQLKIETAKLLVESPSNDNEDKLKYVYTK